MAKVNSNLKVPRLLRTGEYWVVVVGPGGVGKSCLSFQWVKSQFMTEYDPTLEDSYVKQVAIDEEICTVNLIDTAGQEDYAVLLDQRLRDCDAFVIVYDCTSRKSFEETSRFYEKIQRCTEDAAGLPILLVANKMDLSHERKVTREEGMELAAKFGAIYKEASARTKENVDDVFEESVRGIRRVRDAAQKKRDRSDSLNGKHDKNKKKKTGFFSKIFGKLLRRSPTPKKTKKNNH